MEKFEDTKVLELIADYLIKEQLGQGTFGRVYLGYHLLTGCPVAIKIIDKHKIKKNSDLILIKRELHILKNVKHNNIAQLYEILETNERIYLVMEYAKKGDLFNLIKNSEVFTEERAMKYFFQILNAVEYLKKLKIAHRDLKPENILIDQFDKIKIIDFGLSNIYEEDKYLETFCGSPCYVAPEMIIRKKYKAEDIDSWGLGVILYLMVTRTLPFHNNENSLNDLYNQILKTKFKVYSNMSLEALDFFKQIFVFNSENRLNISNMRNHKLLNKYQCNEINNYIFIMKEFVLTDENILNEVSVIFKEEKDVLKNMILFNMHNRYTATYYLIMKIKYLEGETTKFDINSPAFRKFESLKFNFNSKNLSPNSIKEHDRNGEADEIANLLLMNKYNFSKIENPEKNLTFSKEKLMGLKSFKKPKKYNNLFKKNNNSLKKNDNSFKKKRSISDNAKKKKKKIIS